MFADLEQYRSDFGPRSYFSHSQRSFGREYLVYQIWHRKANVSYLPDYASTSLFMLTCLIVLDQRPPYLVEAA